MGPRRTPADDDNVLHPVERVGFSAPVVWSLVAAGVAGAAGFAWFLSGLAHDMVERIGRVEYAVQSLNQTLSMRIETLNASVNVGLSQFEFDAWLREFRAKLQAVDPKLAETVPDQAKREERR